MISESNSSSNNSSAVLLEAKKIIDEYLSASEKKPEPVLKTLRELLEVPVTKESLTSSKVGVAVNKVRKDAANDQVQKAAVQVLSKWKEVMMSRPSDSGVGVAAGSKRPVAEGDDAEAADEKVKLSKTERVEAKKDSDASDTTKATADAAATESSTSLTTSASLKTPASSHNDFLKDYLTGDAVRDKCIEMFVTALLTDSSTKTPDELILSTAQSIERSLFAEFNGVTAAYKTKFRSKYLNLKDAKNPTLREALISGMINAEKFIAMTTAEMASDERKSIDAKIAHQNMLNAQMAKDNAAETDQFKCGRCQQRRCKYYQMQTRSADEPMTTFVTCVNCGNRWRFC